MDRKSKPFGSQGGSSSTSNFSEMGSSSGLKLNIPPEYQQYLTPVENPPRSGYLALPTYLEEIKVPIYSWKSYVQPWDEYPSAANYDKQTLFVRLSVHLQHYFNLNEMESTLQVAFFEKQTLGQSIVNAGDLIINTERVNGSPTKRSRGFYIEKVELTVDVPGGTIQGDYPQDTTKGGTVSSTMGWGVNASGGMFGDMPVLTAGGSYSESNTSSYTYQCIEFNNHSKSTLNHVYRMAGTTSPHGSSYNTWKDLIWSKALHKSTLRGLDDEVSGGDLPIISQGSWSIPMNPWDKKLKVNITLKISMLMVGHHATDEIGDWKAEWWEPTVNPTVISRTINVPWRF